MEYHDFYKEYASKHKFCPKCGSSHHTTTLMGMILSIGEEDKYKDTNTARCCNCDYICQAHDLVGE